MDFMVGHPKTLDKLDYIWVVVDVLTKSSHFIPVRIDYNVEQFAKVYVKEIVSLQGVPLSIISSCGTHFTSNFGGRFMMNLEHNSLLVQLSIHRRMDNQRGLFNH